MTDVVLRICWGMFDGFMYKHLHIKIWTVYTFICLHFFFYPLENLETFLLLTPIELLLCLLCKYFTSRYLDSV